ncbi:MAG: hypothetical protein AB7O97_12130 [Planctomycetota bacterium]
MTATLRAPVRLPQRHVTRHQRPAQAAFAALRVSNRSQPRRAARSVALTMGPSTGLGHIGAGQNFARLRLRRAVEMAGSCIMLLGFLVLALFG